MGSVQPDQALVERRGGRRLFVRLTLVLAASLFALCIAELAHRVYLSSQDHSYDGVALRKQLARSSDSMAAFTPSASSEDSETARAPKVTKAPDGGERWPKRNDQSLSGKTRGKPEAASGETKRVGKRVDKGSERDGHSQPQKTLATIIGATLHPYYGAEMEHDTGGVLAYFRNGPPEKDFKVLVVGGSVAADWARDHGGVFRKALQADPKLSGKDVRVLEFAHAAYKQPQQLTRVAYLFSLGYLPDVVINLDGFNEVANGMRNGMSGTHPTFPARPTWGGILLHRQGMSPAALDIVSELYPVRLESNRILAVAARYQLFHSSLMGTWIQSRMNLLFQHRSDFLDKLASIEELELLDGRRNPELVGPDFARKPGIINALSVSCWYQSSLSLWAICNERDIPYMHGLQPTLLDQGSKPLTEEERQLQPSKHWDKGVQLGYGRLRAAGARLADQGVDFVDFSGCFQDVQQGLYFDSCHFIPEGCEILSGKIAAAFLDRMHE